MTWITARYAGPCRGCGERIEAGFTCLHIKRSGTLCKRCGLRFEGRETAQAELARQRAAFARQTASHEKD